MKNLLCLWSFNYKTLSDIYQYFNETHFKEESYFNNNQELITYIHTSNITHVIIQNPYISKKRLNFYEFLKSKNINIFVSDRGALPNSWFFDPHGFNGFSESYKTSIWDNPLTKEKNIAVENYINTEINSETALEKQGSRIKPQKLKEQLNINNKKVLFVPLQRPSDTVIQYLSGNVKSMKHFLDILVEVQSILSDDWVILLKKHPLEIERLHEDKLHYVSDDTHFKDLLELCDAVSLINSGVGVTAMMYQKPLFYFGEIFYRHPEINKEVKDAQMLIHYLQNDLYRVDFQKVKRFISYLIEDFYSFGEFITHERLEKDGSKRTITSKINFYKINGFEKKSKSKTLLVTDRDSIFRINDNFKRVRFY